ncbi:MAG: hypothetical protein KF851_19775 [Pirellulaceae bacterium]|nr:hypothetical protein [Pirellulaceae bacterium]
MRIAPVISRCLLASFFLVGKQGFTQSSLSVAPKSTYVAILEATEYIDLDALKIPFPQQLALDELRKEWYEASRDFRDLNPTGYSDWHEAQNAEVEKKLRAILEPSQVDSLVFYRNRARLISSANGNAKRSGLIVLGSIFSVEKLLDVLEVSAEQRMTLKQLDEQWGAKILALREELAKQEDKMVEELNETLRKILEEEQRAKYDELIGDPVAVVEPFKAIERIKSGRVYPNSPPSIDSPPQNTRQLAQNLIEITAKRLVFSKKLEDDLALVPSQQKKWDTLRENLEESIKPHHLYVVLNVLGLSPALLDFKDDETAKQTNPQNADHHSRGISSAAAQKLVLEACEEAFEVLLPKQQQWLRQVALQYFVASSGGKFPLRFDWVRSQVNVRSDQSRQMDELLEKHDNKLNELVPEYVERDQKLRDEAEREFYDVLTDAQKKTLALYLGPPKWETDEKDK